MDFEEWNSDQENMPMPKKSGNNFAKGVATGVFGTLIVGFVAVMIFTTVTGAGSSMKRPSLLSDKVVGKIGELVELINYYFYEDTDEEEMANGLYAGLLASLDDRYTEYYTVQQHADLQIAATQNYYGIGAKLKQDADSMVVTIDHIYEGSPAEEAGLKDKDVVIKVEEIEAVSMELPDLVTHIRGEEGTTVHLQIMREGEKDYLEFDVMRANIDLPTVEHKMLDGNIGYIRILEFGAPTIKQFDGAVKELESQGMQAMLLDVRDNPGGMITAVNGILDEMLPEGTMVYTQDKYGKRQVYTSDDEKQMDYPTVVLINGNSASASEILAGAIRDFEYGTLIGTKTFGKGVVQSIIPLEDGDAIKLTTAKYFTPKGENIHGTGIAPDIELQFEYQGDLEGEYDEMQDNQVLKGIEVLKKEISTKE
ncbi:S41 family peptidase [Lachnospiraceae bacterium]|nr:S41 family peptidase [Lachnospiraceae bacterium]